VRRLPPSLNPGIKDGTHEIFKEAPALEFPPESGFGSLVF